jgi:hypothetical protein
MASRVVRVGRKLVKESCDRVTSVMGSQMQGERRVGEIGRRGWEISDNEIGVP